LTLPRAAAIVVMSAIVVMRRTLLPRNPDRHAARTLAEFLIFSNNVSGAFSREI